MRDEADTTVLHEWIGWTSNAPSDLWPLLLAGTRKQSACQPRAARAPTSAAEPRASRSGSEGDSRCLQPNRVAEAAPAAQIHRARRRGSSMTTHLFSAIDGKRQRDLVVAWNIPERPHTAGRRRLAEGIGLNNADRVW